MKIALAFLLTLISTSVFADSIKCFSGNKVIYYHNIRDVTYTGDIFIFTEEGSDRIVMFTGKCMVKMDA